MTHFKKGKGNSIKIKSDTTLYIEKNEAEHKSKVQYNSVFLNNERNR